MKEENKKAPDITLLNTLLKALKTDQLSIETIDEEVEIVRQEIYDRQRSTDITP